MHFICFTIAESELCRSCVAIASGWTELDCAVTSQVWRLRDKLKDLSCYCNKVVMAFPFCIVMKFMPSY